MTTLIDILDTAIKIGLGASIAGLSSYALSRRNHLHENQKRSTEDRKSLSKEVALKIENAKSKTDASAYKKGRSSGHPLIRRQKAYRVHGVVSNDGRRR
jgi:hypothetical protein